MGEVPLYALPRSALKDGGGAGAGAGESAEQNVHVVSIDTHAPRSKRL